MSKPMGSGTPGRETRLSIFSRMTRGMTVLVMLLAMLLGAGRVSAATCAGHGSMGHPGPGPMVAGQMAAGHKVSPADGAGAHSGAAAHGSHAISSSAAAGSDVAPASPHPRAHAAPPSAPSGHHAGACATPCCIAACQPYMAAEPAAAPVRTAHRSQPATAGGPQPAGRGADVAVPPPRSFS